jgi:hypothetical protein
VSTYHRPDKAGECGKGIREKGGRKIKERKRQTKRDMKEAILSSILMDFFFQIT